MRHASAIVVLACGTTLSSAQVAFDTYTPAGTHSTNLFYAVPYTNSTNVEQIGFRFISRDSGPVQRITLSAVRNNLTPAPVVQLYADDAGLPGARLGEWPINLPVTPPGSLSFTSVDIANGPSLSGGSPYFLVVRQPIVSLAQRTDWYIGSVTNVGTLVWRGDESGSWEQDEKPYAAFRVIVPAPHSAAALGIFFVAASLRRRR
ncbi:MAG: hypothetical protein SFY69_08000 [Planctomycetota bacterium]|nr:hypothetical protein [Planctomycetota bacterium]